jgi:hypothetical protein
MGGAALLALLAAGVLDRVGREWTVDSPLPGSGARPDLAELRREITDQRQRWRPSRLAAPSEPQFATMLCQGQGGGFGRKNGLEGISRGHYSEYPPADWRSRSFKEVGRQYGTDKAKRIGPMQVCVPFSVQEQQQQQQQQQRIPEHPYAVIRFCPYVIRFCPCYTGVLRSLRQARLLPLLRADRRQVCCARHCPMSHPPMPYLTWPVPIILLIVL